MPYIKVDLNKITDYARMLNEIGSRVQRIKSDFTSIGWNLDWDIKSSSNISRRISATNSELSSERSSLSKTVTFLNNARNKYADIDSSKPKVSFTAVSRKITTVGPGGQSPSFIQYTIEHFDVKDAVIDMIKSGFTVYDLHKHGFFKSGLLVKEVGDYFHVYGKNKTWTYASSPIKDLVGRRYKKDSVKAIKSGVGAYAKNISASKRFVNSLKHGFKGFGKDTYASKSSILAYVGIAFDVYGNVTDNMAVGASTSKIAADATTEVAKGLGSMAVAAAGAKVGAALGTLIPVPVLGTAVGAVCGAAVGIAATALYDYVIDGVQIGGKSIAGWVSTGLEKAYSAVGDAVKGTAKAVSNVAKSAAKAASNVVKSVGSAVKSAAKGVKNFFGKLFG